MKEQKEKSVHFLLHQYLKFSLISLHPGEFSNYFYSFGKIQGAEKCNSGRGNLIDKVKNKFKGREEIIRESGIEERWKNSGFGDLEVLSEEKFRIYGSPDSLLLPDTGEKTCLYNTGLLTGYLSELFDEKIKVRETRCLSQGGSYCEFEVSEGDIPVPSAESAEKIKKGVLDNIKEEMENPHHRGVSIDLGRLMDSIKSFRAPRALFSSIGRDFGNLIGKEIKEVDFDDYVREFRYLLEFLGGGSIEVSKFDPLAVDLRMRNSPFVFDNSEDKTCHFLTGAFKGAMEEYSNTRWHAVEDECASQGNENCEIKCRNI